MTYHELKQVLKTMDSLTFNKKNGESIPKHFHITEVGLISKNFIDCGGTIRSEEKINFQLWYSIDVMHRLKADKLLGIMKKAEKHFPLQDHHEIEIEYQSERTIGKHGLEFDGENFILTNTQTACLATEKCGVVDTVVEKVAEVTGCCDPKSGCC